MYGWGSGPSALWRKRERWGRGRACAYCRCIYIHIYRVEYSQFADFAGWGVPGLPYMPNYSILCKLCKLCNAKCPNAQYAQYAKYAKYANGQRMDRTEPLLRPRNWLVGKQAGCLGWLAGWLVGSEKKEKKKKSGSSSRCRISFPFFFMVMG